MIVPEQNGELRFQVPVLPFDWICARVIHWRKLVVYVETKAVAVVSAKSSTQRVA